MSDRRVSLFAILAFEVFVIMVGVGGGVDLLVAVIAAGLAGAGAAEVAHRLLGGKDDDKGNGPGGRTDHSPSALSAGTPTNAIQPTRRAWRLWRIRNA